MTATQNPTATDTTTNATVEPKSIWDTMETIIPVRKEVTNDVTIPPALLAKLTEAAKLGSLDFVTVGWDDATKNNFRNFVKAASKQLKVTLRISDTKNGDKPVFRVSLMKARVKKAKPAELPAAEVSKIVADGMAVIAERRENPPVDATTPHTSAETAATAETAETAEEPTMIRQPESLTSAIKEKATKSKK